MAKYYVEITKTAYATVEAEDEDEALAIANDYLAECDPDNFHIEKVEE
jgi:hypothetical protein